MSFQCLSIDVVPVYFNRCRSSVFQSMSFQCISIDVVPVSFNRCRSSVFQSMSFRCLSIDVVPVSLNRCRSSVSQSMFVLGQQGVAVHFSYSPRLFPPPNHHSLGSSAVALFFPLRFSTSRSSKTSQCVFVDQRALAAPFRLCPFVDRLEAGFV